MKKHKKTPFWIWIIVAILVIHGVVFRLYRDSTKSNNPEIIPEQETSIVSEETTTTPPNLTLLNELYAYEYTTEQIDNMRTILSNVGITEIWDAEIGNVVSGMQVVKGLIYEDYWMSTEVRVQFNIENGIIYLVSIYCPSYHTENQPTYLSGLNDRRADLYYDVDGGYLKRIDWETKTVVDYE